MLSTKAAGTSSKLFKAAHHSSNNSFLLNSLVGSYQTRFLNNWTWRPTKDYENQFVVGKAPHAKRKPAKKFYKWTPNPSVPKKEIEEHNAKVNPAGGKKEQIISSRNKEFIQQIYEAGKQYKPKEAIDAYHRCSHGIDVRAYSSIIKSMEKEAAHIGDAFQVYNDMKKMGKKANIVTFTHLLNVCINANHLPRALYVMKEMMKTVTLGKDFKQSTKFFAKLIRLCYLNNEPGRAFAVYDCMRAAKSGEFTPEEVAEDQKEVSMTFLKRVILEKVPAEQQAAESEKIREFWVGMNKAKRPSFSSQVSPTLPSSTNLSHGLLGKSSQRAIYENELRKLQRLTEANEERGNNPALDFDEFGLSTRDHIELRSLSMDLPLHQGEHGDMDEALKISYKTGALEFSHLFYSSIFNDNNYRPLVSQYSETTESLASQYTEALKQKGELSEKDIALEVDSFKAYAEAHSYIYEAFQNEEGKVLLSEAYLNALAGASEENWVLTHKQDHQIESNIPTIIGASPSESAILLAKPAKKLLEDFIGAETIDELMPVMEEYKEEMKKATRYVNRKVDWQPVILGVDGRPFFPSEEIISIDEVTSETIEKAKQAYIDSIKDEEVKKQIREEFYDYIHLVWIDNKGRVVEGISY